MSELIDSQGKIIPNLRGDIMRSSMENKNILSHKGSLYVGTGTTISKTVATTDGRFEVIKIPKTTNLDPGSVHQVLCNLDAKGNLGYRFIGPSMIQEDTFYDIKCTRAHNANFVVSAEEATRPIGSGTDTRTIEERLTAAETPITGVCSVKFNRVTSNGKRGDISLNKLYKKGVGVTLSFSMYNSEFYNGDTLVLTIPSEFRPKSAVSITVGFNTYFSYVDHEFYDDSRYSTIQYQTQITTDGTITIRGDAIDSLVGRPSEGCRGIYIYTGWNIYQNIY